MCERGSYTLFGVQVTVCANVRPDPVLWRIRSDDLNTSAWLQVFCTVTKRRLSGRGQSKYIMCRERTKRLESEEKPSPLNNLSWVWFSFLEVDGSNANKYSSMCTLFFCSHSRDITTL